MALDTASGLASFDVTTARKVDISDLLSAILTQETALVGRIKKTADVKDTLHKWPEDTLAPNTVTCNEDTFSNSDPADAAHLTLAATMGDRLRVGALLKDTAAGKSEVLQVITIDSATQVHVTRGYGSTSAEAHAVDSVWRIIGSPIQENSEVAVGDDKWSGTGPTLGQNYSQLFERKIIYGDTMENVSRNGMIAGVKDWFAHQSKKRTLELAQELGDTFINGISAGSIGSDTVYRSMMGLIEFLSQSNSLKDTTTEDFTEAVANEMVRTAWNQGAMITHLLISADLLSAVTAWESDRVRMANDNQKAGRQIRRWMSELGIELDIIVDRFMPGDCAAAIKLDDITFGALKGDDWHTEKLARTGRLTKWQLSGQFTLEVKNALKGHILHTNLSA